MRGVASALVLVTWVAAWSRADTQVGGEYEVETIKDVVYYNGKDAEPVKHKLDVYVPKGAKEFPVLFFIHGGAWKSGDKWLYGGIGNIFAKNGIGTVITNYRLSPKVQHPAHIQDVAKAFAWTHRNIAKHGGRNDRIFVTGHSAGGHLSALLVTDESYLKAEKLDTSAIRGALPLSGVYRIGGAKLFNNVFGTDEKVCKLASPLSHVREKLPPFFIAYADQDFATCDKMSIQLGEELRRYKCEAEILEVKDRNHINVIVRAANQADPLTQGMLTFIAKHAGMTLRPLAK